MSNECCDDPDIWELPKRAAKLPSRRTRETFAECQTCGETWGAQ